MKFTSGPTVAANPNMRVPLAAVVEFATDTPSRAIVEVSASDRKWRAPSDAAAETRHRVPVVGIRPGESCTVSVAAEDSRGDRIAAPAPLAFTAPRLPAGFPPVAVKTCLADRREPGAMLFNIRHSPASEHHEDFGLVVAIDRDGGIAWYYGIDEAVGDVRRLANGNILYVADGRICEIDLLGDTVAEWYAEGRWEGKTPPAGAVPVAAGMFHHAVIELPSGNILACSMEIREIDGFPLKEHEPDGETGTARVVGDVIVEFARDGTVVNEYRLLDLLDARRVCYGSRAAYWVHRGFPDTCDWSHLNGLAYDADAGCIVASVRHQDCMIGIDRATGALEWILGTPANWRAPWSDKLLSPEDGLEWQYHQHDCSMGPGGTILCFDNGNERATPPDPKMDGAASYSRAVEFAVDTDARTVRQVWCRGRDEDGTYSAFQSGVCRLPGTGNIFIDYGGVCTVDGVPSGKVFQGHCLARLIEVTPGAEGEIVFELIVDDAAADDPAALSSFRAEHFPDFGRQPE
ncbi:MAG: aryl-sulfate sulfotransferase [Defluviicoccus sp.]|nr:aryl-sulfate sulfotransferase [Defluviicoccus sp.]